MPINVYPANNTITYADSPNLDAFARLRVGNPFAVLENKQIHSNNGNQFSEVTAGGGTVTFQYDRSSSYLSVGTASGDRALRQSIRYLSYVPGKSQQIIFTGVFAPGIANRDQYAMYGDDLNGLFFKYQGTTFGVGVRSSVSGSPVDTFISQSNWNVDTLDGTGPSGKTLDLTKSQIMMVDFQWLGVGRIRYYMGIAGMPILIHEILNANNSTSVYMKTPTLPVRFDIINTGTTSSSGTFEMICFAVTSEGGYTLPGLEFSASNATTRISASTTTTPILAIRLLAAFPTGEPNRITGRFLNVKASATTNDAHIELAHVHSPVFGATTWNPVAGGSGMEYSTSIGSVTGSPAHIVEHFDIAAGIGSAAGLNDVSVDFINAHSFISQNFDSTNSQAFVVYATSFSGSSNVSSSVAWIESD